MPKVHLRLTQEGKTLTLDAPKKTNLLKLLQEHEVPVGNACGGNGLCASCKVIVLEGASNLSRPNSIEIDLAERNRLPQSERISCQCQVLGDLTLTTTYW